MGEQLGIGPQSDARIEAQEPLLRAYRGNEVPARLQLRGEESLRPQNARRIGKRSTHVHPPAQNPKYQPKDPSKPILGGPGVGESFPPPDAYREMEETREARRLLNEGEPDVEPYPITGVCLASAGIL